jgi:hypothetical protein
MRIVFTPVPGGECVTTFHRRDGVVVAMPSYSRKWRVPHDLAHAVAERELSIADGVFGSVAAGAMFANVRVISGRPRHDSAQRSQRILAANRRMLGVAEVVAGALHDCVEEAHRNFRAANPADAPATNPGRHVREALSVSAIGPLPWTDDTIRTATDTLRSLATEWTRVPAGGTLEFFWPDRLVKPVPPPPRARRSAARFAPSRG